jgi:hypothetical protein
MKISGGWQLCTARRNRHDARLGEVSRPLPAARLWHAYATAMWGPAKLILATVITAWVLAAVALMVMLLRL